LAEREHAAHNVPSHGGLARLEVDGEVLGLVVVRREQLVEGVEAVPDGRPWKVSGRPVEGQWNVSQGVKAAPGRSVEIQWISVEIS